MQSEEVLVILTDKWADWEASYTMAVINSFSERKLEVKTAALDKQAKVSMGGIRAEIDYVIKEYQNFDNLVMVIIPGGLSWKENNYVEIADFIRVVSNLHIPVAAICGATIFLGKHGLLDKIRHTGDELEYFQREVGYKGQELYVSAQVVVDKGFITANETAAVEFAYEIFKVLKIDTEEEMNQWFDNFKYGAVREKDDKKVN